MEASLIQERQQAHELLDLLPPEQLNAVRSVLEVMVHPAETLTRSLALAPVDADELTLETAEALERARASIANGEGIPHDEILREFGLSR